MTAIRDRSLTLALVFSALLHLTLFMLMPLLPKPGDGAVIEPPLEVALLPPEPPKAKPAAPAPRQMVAPPDQINDRPPENPHFESDRDNTVEHETVNPGVPNPGPAEPPAPKAGPAQKASAPDRASPAKAHQLPERPAPAPVPAPRQAIAEPKHAPALDDLFLGDKLVNTHPAESEPAESNAQTGSGKRKFALAVAPVSPDWALPGSRGTLDNLPDIQRGNVTLLNTKANVFSPFVRRVGERVFQHLIIRQRRLELQQIMNARSPVQMRAILDAHGKLKSVQIEGQSGSALMDDTLSDALNTAAFDNNPPAAAANANGEFEFLFQAQLRAYTPAVGGGPGRIESRLSVGLL